MSKETRLICVAGVARAGKDSAARCIKKVLEEKGISAEIKSLATPLKAAMYKFLLDSFGIDIYTCNDQEKALVRPLLVEWGRVQRIQTSGRWFTSQMDAEIENSTADVVIVPDLRYQDWGDTDELAWAKNRDAIIFHVSKVLKDGTVLQPPNED